MILILLSLSGAVVRLWQLAAPSYWMDESFSVATAQAVLQGDFFVRSPLYHLLLAAVGWISNWNIFAMRGLSVAIGIVMLVVGYYISKRWLTKPMALTFTGLLAFTTLEIAWSRQIRMYGLLQLLFLVSIYFYYQWRTRKIHWIFPLITTVATMLTHEFGFYLLFVYVWYELLLWFRRPLVPISVILVSLFVVSHLIVPTLPYINYWWHYVYFIGTHHAVLIILAICGVYVFTKKYPLVAQWLVTSWLGWLFCLSFVVPLLQYRYLLMTMSILLLFTAAGAVWLWQQRWFGKILLGTCAGLLLWQQQLTILPQTFYPLESDPPTAPFVYKTFTPQPNFKAAYTFLEQYSDSIIATPYPLIHQLYTHELPDYIIFVNLTGGTYPTIPKLETYTQLPYSDSSVLLSNQEIILIADQFAEYRLDKRWQSVIAQAEVIWEDDNPPWSDLRIYRIVPL